MILKFLLPLGLLGLISIAALIIIYLLKPQYKEKMISSTVVWKRLLLRKKKHKPIITNILILILQALSLICLALGLGQPYLFSENILYGDSEHIIILDASASMMAKFTDEDERTRFDKAKLAAKENVKELFDGGDGYVYVILADNDPHYIVSGLSKTDADVIDDAIDQAQCSYGEADVKRAFDMAQEHLDKNPYAEVYLLTDTQYGNMGTAVTVKNFANPDREWNVAISGCTVTMRDNEWTFDVSLSAYGNIAMKKTLQVEITGADNGSGKLENYNLNIPVTFEVNTGNATLEESRTITFKATDVKYGGNEEWFFDSFEQVKLSLPELGDSIAADDTFYCYGGKRDIIRVEYVSSEPNVFWQFGFINFGNNSVQRRRIDYREIFLDRGETPKNSGYDIYVFEHQIPSFSDGLPSDGVIILSDPDASVSTKGINFTLSSKVSHEQPATCTAIAEHPLIEYMTPSKIGITSYNKLITDDPTLLPILYCGEDPVIYAKNTGDVKIIVLPFSINNSDFYGGELQLFIRNLIEYYLPVTLNKTDFSFGEEATVISKGIAVDVTDPTEKQETLISFPAEYEFPTVGTYTFSTKFAMKKPEEVRKAYVHAPGKESALFAVSDFSTVLNNREMTGEAGTDLFVYLAIILLVLLMAEWRLQFKDIV